MLRKIAHIGFYWCPPVIWASGIFLLSSMSNPPTPPSFPYSDKIGHFLLYAILALLLRRALEQGQSFSPSRASRTAFLLTVIYGVLDEFHQHFVPNRSVEWADWISDALGAATPFLTCLIPRKTQKKKGADVHEQSGSTTAN